MNSWQCGNVCMIDFLFYDTFRYSTNVHIFYNPRFLRIPVLYNLKIFSFLPSTMVDLNFIFIYAIVVF